MVIASTLCLADRIFHRFVASIIDKAKLMVQAMRVHEPSFTTATHSSDQNRMIKVGINNALTKSRKKRRATGRSETHGWKELAGSQKWTEPKQGR